MRVALPLAMLCGALALVPGDATAWLAFDRDAILAGQLWRCWTGHLVHFSLPHALVDVAVLFLVTGILEREAGWRAAALMLLSGAPLISLGLLVAVPDLRIYEGASGISMLAGVAAGCFLWRAARRLRLVLGALAAGALLKMWLDSAGALPAFASLPEGIRVAWQVHAMGAALGALFAAVLLARSQRHRRSSQSSTCEP